MKTIKYLSILLMTILCLGTVSCSKDDDEKKKNKDDIENNEDDENDEDDKATLSIIGTWKFDDGDGWSITLKLNNDDSFKLTDTEILNGKPDTSIDEGTYRYNKSKSELKLTLDDGEIIVFKVISLSSTKLKLYDEEEEGFTYTFTKK
ncbi:conserved hypothetical protein [Bacteroides sp. 3_1_23]|uniref:copper resistance protein NlpE N-terminal domain-containing protein n=1 Tax=Bacteroides sp. 3_1_23 TaxID=457390 RepID=UPI0001DAA36A|nr:copper resistance protein NlpE N-terminal domain-containing protein [Bacteroides sp. 3_1_23]EFI40752.1 conserved hypothetical protein [Bacteroides sp. 3_1_23]